MKKPKIFIACDTTNLEKVKKIINQSKTSKIQIGYKFGLEFMNSNDFERLAPMGTSCPDHFLRTKINEFIGFI